MNQGPAARDPRALVADNVLAELGLAGARVDVEGEDKEIAVLVVPTATRHSLLDGIPAEVAAAIRKLGFRYIALDLGPDVLT